jgi:uncharacterized Fe-S cluster protein YjdI
MEIKHYHNNDITLTWEPAKCIHSAVCFKGLPQVFDPRKKPWITLENEATETIIKQVKQCPSGAISFTYKNDLNAQNNSNIENESLLKVQVTPAGPLLVHGNFALENNNEITPVNAKVTALCRCGHSSNKPFCDGSHRKIEFDK